MLLAAGRGERMRPLTDALPKPLIEVAGRPLIEWHLTKLQAAGIENVVINVAYLAQQIIDLLGDGSRFDLTITYSHESAGALETAGGIIKALPLLGDQPFLVVNADVWLDTDFSEMVHTRLASYLAHLWLVETPAFKSRGDFYLDNGVINDAALGEWLTFAGVSVMCANLFAPFMCDNKEKALALLPVLNAAIAQRKVTAQRLHSDWEDVGTVERLRALNKRLIRQN